MLFTGRWLDQETKNVNSKGLYYYRAREYDPELGRFLQRDPIGIWGDTANLGNGYTHVANNITNWEQDQHQGHFQDPDRYQLTWPGLVWTYRYRPSLRACAQRSPTSRQRW